MDGSDSTPPASMIGLVVLAVLVFVAFSAVVWVGVLMVGRDQGAAEKDSPAILDQAFDGRSDVTFKIHMRSLKYETVVAGAKARGYELAHQAGDPNGAMTLMFEKV